MKKTINVMNQSVTFTFDGLEPVTLAMSKVSPVNATYAMLHGFAARIGDNAAIAKSADNGFTVTEAMRRAEVEAMVKFYENVENKDWNMRAPAGSKAVPMNPAVMALAEKLGKSYQEAMVYIVERAMADLA